MIANVSCALFARPCSIAAVGALVVASRLTAELVTDNNVSGAALVDSQRRSSIGRVPSLQFPHNARWYRQFLIAC